ncbi:hypothetical protein OG562_40170 [Streptomyces sp. NBC_01275]|uniref:hypothetical protein n=1 Tax=Streptomyces sp. NBC_01275 TaxID=2903807 RepID=UPI002254F986|nr:hypothetical protein [Streptomyces sp. NBC_01275]MCX4767080.1 hypothetical protein [Streptomyces sp. NBC_01275]
MISTRRIVAIAALAAGVTGLAAPLASAAEAPDGKLHPLTMLDSLAASELPAGRQGELPKVSQQLSEVKKVNQLEKLSELHQITDLAAPVTGLLPAVEA